MAFSLVSKLSRISIVREALYPCVKGRLNSGRAASTSPVPGPNPDHLLMPSEPAQERASISACNSEVYGWTVLPDIGKILPALSKEVKLFLGDIGKKEPLEILFADKHQFVSDMTINAVKYSSSPRLRALESDFVLGTDPREDALPFRALVVLAASKLFGNPGPLERMSTDCKRSVERQQLQLGFCTEFLFISQLFHDTVLDVVEAEASQAALVHRENKVGTLVGDLCITKMYSALAALENNQVVELMSQALATFSENAFSGYLHSMSPGDYAEPRTPLQNLFGSSFRSAMILAGHDTGIQELAEELGHIFGRTYQAYRILRKPTSASAYCSRLASSSDANVLRNGIEDLEQFIKHIPMSKSNASFGAESFRALLKHISI